MNEPLNKFNNLVPVRKINFLVGLDMTNSAIEVVVAGSRNGTYSVGLIVDNKPNNE